MDWNRHTQRSLVQHRKQLITSKTVQQQWQFISANRPSPHNQTWPISTHLDANYVTRSMIIARRRLKQGCRNRSFKKFFGFLRFLGFNVRRLDTKLALK